jgi:GntR family phosphonate transport system transcriptional regulator
MTKPTLAMPALIQRHAALPVWRQVEAALLLDIRSGAFEEGSKLPPAAALAQRFEVNRHTVRHAIDSLEERGFLRTQVGLGSFVQEHPYHYPIGRRTRFGRAMTELSVKPHYNLIAADVQKPSRQVALALALPPGERVHRILYSTHVEGRTIDFSQAYFPATRFPNLGDTFRRELSVTRTLAEYGVTDYLRKHTAVMAKLPSAEVALVLGQPSRRPVLCVHSFNVDTQGAPVQFGITYFAGDWVQLTVSSED